MPIIDITLLEGRSPADKVALVRAVTDACVESIGAPRETVRIMIRELPLEHYAVGGVPKKMPPGVD
ncbi:MAG: 2-hydroxymuconate tautomerase family protein [Rhodobacterales bacterium]|nr:2-hydroxymuconate tautomerase family protein [Rhodobacterales bacterium]